MADHFPMCSAGFESDLCNNFGVLLTFCKAFCIFCPKTFQQPLAPIEVTEIKLTFLDAKANLTLPDLTEENFPYPLQYHSFTFPSLFLSHNGVLLKVFQFKEFE